MRLKNGFLTQDSDQTICFHTERPNLYGTNWSSPDPIYVKTEMFDDIDLGDDFAQSLRQVLNGRVIMPLPELEVDARVEALVDGVWRKLHFSHFNGYGTMYVSPEGTTSWSATAGVHEVDEWRLPEEG